MWLPFSPRMRFRMCIFLVCIGVYMMYTRDSFVPAAPDGDVVTAATSWNQYSDALAATAATSSATSSLATHKQAPDETEVAWNGEKLGTCKCKFPFSHDEESWGKKHVYSNNHCTSRGHNELWCATKVDSKTNNKLDWGNCAEVCPVNCAAHTDCNLNHYCDAAGAKTCTHCRRCGDANECSARCANFIAAEKAEQAKFQAASVKREAAYQKEIKRKKAEKDMADQRAKDIAQMKAEKARKEALARKREELKAGGLYGPDIPKPPTTKQHFDTSKMRKQVQRLMTSIPNINKVSAFSSIAELTSTNTEEENQTLALAYLNKNEKLLLLGTNPPQRKNLTWLPSVSIIVPTCFDRHKWHHNIPTMFHHQDYTGKMEIIIADGKCQSSHTCTTNKTTSSNPLEEAQKRDPRIKYHANVESKHLGEKRNWLLDHATGEVIIHFDDDDYYAPHYVRFMVDAIFYSKADVVRLLSWITYGEGFTLSPWTRFPIMEWEEQHGFGWAYSYAYTKKYGLANRFSDDKDASEEKNFVTPFQYTGTRPDVLVWGSQDTLIDVRTAQGPTANMIVFDRSGKAKSKKPLKTNEFTWLSIPDIYLSSLRIASWSCMRTTGNIPQKDCSMHDEANGRLCKILTEDTGARTMPTQSLVHMLYGKRVLPFLAMFDVKQ